MYEKFLKYSINMLLLILAIHTIFFDITISVLVIYILAFIAIISLRLEVLESKVNNLISIKKSEYLYDEILDELKTKMENTK